MRFVNGAGLHACVRSIRRLSPSIPRGPWSAGSAGSFSPAGLAGWLTGLLSEPREVEVALPSNITITVTKKRTLSGWRYDWTAASPTQKLAKGKRCLNRRAVEHALHQLFGPRFNGHKIVDETGEDA